ncbi:class I SAM-dependent methyltransferase [Roseivirga sp.]|uniref:class I SAM-dependent methyltransferase n=1 Tax=Roseivirga sp. TaxID=1964215 RepID=UPI003B52C299
MNKEINNRQERFWDKMAASYDREERKAGKKQQQILQLIQSELRPTDTVLDFGCATGLFSVAIAPKVKSVYGTDISSRMIEQASLKAGKAGVTNVTFTRDFAFDNGQFNLIIVLHVLHLVDDPKETLKKLAELLQPGGTMVTVTPCLGKKPLLKTMLTLLSCLRLVPKPHAFKLNQLKDLFLENQLEITLEDTITNSPSEQIIVARKA